MEQVAVENSGHEQAALHDAGLEHHDVIIIGAGLSGLCVAIKLQEAGINDFVILEKENEIGGTWRDNTYPGSGCDVPSHLYSYSFEPNPGWSRRFSGQSEILDYIHYCAQKYNLPPSIRLNCEVTSARFDETQGRWHLTMMDGRTLSARAVVSGLGQLNRPGYPDIPGCESFAGTAFHSARWNHNHVLDGKTVAVIGNGASAVQFIPRIAPMVKRLFIFQRSPNWVVPKPDRAYTPQEKRLFRMFPWFTRLYRLFIYSQLEKNFLAFFKDSRFGKVFARGAALNMESQVTDDALRNVLKPGYPVGCKRILLSNDYYPALERPNVEVVTAPITRIMPEGLETGDGQNRAVDTIIYATGFTATDFLSPMAVTGCGGRDLNEAWREGAEAYLGITLPGFPNFFMMYGPNTNLGHNSIIYMIESQTRYIVQCIQEILNNNLVSLDVRKAVMSRYNQALKKRIERSVWDADCHSWYKNDAGKVTNNWPGWTFRYRALLRRPRFSDFERRAAAG